MTSSNGNIFRVTGHLCGEFTAHRPVTRGFDVFLGLRLNKRLSKQSWGWWFETLSRPLRRHCNVSQQFLHDNATICKHNFLHPLSSPQNLAIRCDFGMPDCNNNNNNKTAYPKNDVYIIRCCNRSHANTLNTKWNFCLLLRRHGIAGMWIY